MTDDDKTRRAAAFENCTRSLSFHRKRAAADWLKALAASPHAASAPDVYGEGELIQKLERDVATLLGKEAAVF
jgi:threonine aldolase